MIKYLLQFSKSTASISKQHSTSIMNGEVATFILSSFEEFVTSYKTNNNALASEAVEAFNHFLPTLDKFFDLLDKFKEMDDASNIFIKWYSSAKIFSNDTIRANSNWYQQASDSSSSIFSS